jgi:hypothetical protein
MSGFAMRCFHHARLVAFQRKMKQHRGRCILETLFGVHEAPADTQRRDMLDGMSPELLRPLLTAVVATVRRTG